MYLHQFDACHPVLLNHFSIVEGEQGQFKLCSKQTVPRVIQKLAFCLFQVAGAVVKSGGDQIQIESDEFVAKNGPVKTGEIAVTGPGNLPCKIVIHAVGRTSCFTDSV